MSTVSTTISYNSASLARELAQFVSEVAAEVEKDARANTPIKTGHARAGWSKTVTPKSFTVKNQVPYIGKLEAGASKQAPKGIIGPTLSQVKGKYK